jgi:hypothetical protein
MATFEDIKKANETIATTNIKGKEYAEVNQRIKAFRMVYPEGSIITELVELSEGICTIKAIAKNGETVLGTGLAQEKESSSYINKTSYIENCETSAVGRALGMCGFGIDTSICSADELENSLKNQSEKTIEYATEEQIAKLNKYYEKSTDKYRKVLKKYGVTNAVQLKKIEAQSIINRVEAEMLNAGIPIEE